MKLVGDALAAAAHRLGADRDAVLARLGGEVGAMARAAAARIDVLGAARPAARVDAIGAARPAAAALPRPSPASLEAFGSARPAAATPGPSPALMDVFSARPAVAAAHAGPSPASMARAEAMARARVPLLAGLRGVDATWIEAALAPLPPRARAALAGGIAATDVDVDVWLARWATARFVPLEPVAAAQLPREPRDLAALAPDAAMRWLADVGLDQLAHALGAEAAQLPALADARARIARPPRFGQLGPQRAALVRCRGLVPPLDTERLVVLGTRAIAPHVAGASALIGRALAQRLPRSLGECVLEALGAFARDAGAPAWPALAAG